MFKSLVPIFHRIINKIIYIYEQSHYNVFRKKYEIEKGFRFEGKGINLYGNGRIILKKNTYIGDNASIQSHSSCLVQIGENCSISHNVRIYTYNLDADEIIKGNKILSHTKKGNVIIGNNCWIGANVLIKENVTIGNNCVIAANSLVTRNAPDGSILMGVPAKIVKTYEYKENLEIID